MPVTRRDFLEAAVLDAALPRFGNSDPPNILWITCEDMCPDLGCYDDSWARTPNLDRLASQGVRYSNAFSVYGVCAPSRSSIITAMYPASIGTHHMRSQGVPPPFVKCFPEHLRAEGYYCTNNFKTDYNFDSPLTAWDECSTKAHWRNRPKGRRFFSVFNITTTHESQIWPENFAQHAGALKPEERHDPARATLPPYYPDTPSVRADWARYYDLITLMDRQAGEIVRQLDEDGLASETAVFFFADHGRGLPRAKRWVYDASLHVPLIVRWPGRIRPGASSDRLVSLVDLGPSVLAIAGVPLPPGIQGRPFLPDGPERRYIYAGRDRMDETYDLIRAVRDKRYKYIRNFQPGKPYAQYIDYMEKGETMKEMRRLNKQGKLAGAERLFFLPEKPPEELYDIRADPHEVNNLAGSPEHQAVVKRMREELDDFMKRTGDLGLVAEEELRERMRPGGVWQVTKPPKIDPDGGAFPGPVQVRIACSTEGSSIAWAVEPAGSPRWNLYSRPITLDRSATLRAKACRLGYKDSEEVHADFRIG